jgi:hypothetical protein
MKLANFYEVKDSEGNSTFGSESALETIRFYRRIPNAKIVVTVWDTEKGEDMVLVNDQVDVTALVLATISDQMERANPL